MILHEIIWYNERDLLVRTSIRFLTTQKELAHGETFKLSWE